MIKPLLHKIRHLLCPEEPLHPQRGRRKLWLWFFPSQTSFVILPRVLMHEMPDEWQWRMAELLWDFENAFPNAPKHDYLVQTRIDGKIAKLPRWLLDYRQPDREQIAKLRGVQ